MMVVPKTIPFAIELKSEDNGLAGVAHLKLESAIKIFINAIYKE